MAPHIEKPLTERERRFVAEYVTDFNQTRSAIAAGYSKKGAHVQGHRLLARANIRLAVKGFIDKLVRPHDHSAERILKETALVAYSDLGDIFNDDGSLKPIKDMPEHVRRSISSIEVEEKTLGAGGETVIALSRLKKLRTWDKMAALTLMAKAQKLLTEKVEHSGTIEVKTDFKGVSDEQLVKEVQELAAAVVKR